MVMKGKGEAGWHNKINNNDSWVYYDNILKVKGVSLLRDREREDRKSLQKTSWIKSTYINYSGERNIWNELEKREREKEHKRKSSSCYQILRATKIKLWFCIS